MGHVNHIRWLNIDGILEICGVRKGNPGMAGMYTLKTNNCEEAKVHCEQESLIVGGYTTYKLIPLQIANRENKYLLG